MATTIQVSEELAETLKEMKFSDNESYEEVIWDIIEDTKELSKETKQHLVQAEKDIRDGRVLTPAQLKEELGL